MKKFIQTIKCFFIKAFVKRCSFRRAVQYVYFIENKHTHEWISKEEQDINGFKYGTMTIDPLMAQQYETKKIAQSNIQCGYEYGGLKCWWNKLSNHGNPDDFIVTEHEFVLAVTPK